MTDARPSRRELLLAGALAAALPAAFAQASGRRPVFVLNSLDADVSVIDPAAWKETRRLPTGKEPHHLYLSPDEKTLLVANAASNSITFLDPTTAAVLRTVPNIVDPYHLRFSPDMKWFVTAANRLDHVDLYHWQGAAAEQPFKLIKRLPAPDTPSHLAIDSRSSVVYASLQDSDELLAIDIATQAPRWKVKVGKMPADLYLSADDRTLLVALTADKVVGAWDVSGPAPRLARRIVTADGAHAFRAQGDKRHVFVSNRVANSISRIDVQTLEVKGTFPCPGGPDCMELLADGKTLLVSSRWARRLSVIDSSTGAMLVQVPVGRSPHGVWTLDHAARI
jgi:YVTN family beta-propeller protein